MIVTYLIYLICAGYLALGVIYAGMIIKEGIEPWYTFPINILFGPTVYLFNYYNFYKKGKIPKQ